MHPADDGAIFPGMAKHPKRPRDPNQLAHMVVGIATGDLANPKLTAAQERARAGGAKGGPARARALTERERSEIAAIAAAARWKKG